MSDNKKVNKLLGEVSKKYGISKEQLESAAQSGNIENLLKNTQDNSLDYKAMKRGIGYGKRPI